MVSQRGANFRTWSDTENQEIDRLIKAHPFATALTIADEYNAWATQNGFQQRSIHSMRAKLKSRGRKASCGLAFTWSNAEDQQLISMVGSLPFQILCSGYNAWARSEGHPQRTRNAIGKRIKVLNAGSLIPVGDYLTTGSICLMLQCSDMVVHRWVKKGFIEAYTFKGSHYEQGRSNTTDRRTFYFRRKEIVQLARDMPHLFAGCTKQNLFLLLEDEELSESIAENHPRRNGAPRPIKNLDTGHTFPSAKKAADWANKFSPFRTDRTGVAQAARAGCRAANYRWQYL